MKRESGLPGSKGEGGGREEFLGDFMPTATRRLSVLWEGGREKEKDGSFHEAEKLLDNSHPKDRNGWVDALLEPFRRRHYLLESCTLTRIKKGGHRTFSARMVIKPTAPDRKGAGGSKKASKATGPRAKAKTAEERITFMVNWARRSGRCSTWA